jgi:uncharacterized membrane protein
MKHSDIIQLRELNLITEEQQQKIITQLNLKEDGGGKLLMILSTIGAVLVVTGIILLISANWEAIPRFVKIASGIGLMLAAWAVGWFLREMQGVYHKAGEGLYLVGAGLWLANIALIGQIYHLSSRPSNAFLLWLAGIAATPWILRSKALFVLMLGAFGIWLSVDMNNPGGIFGSNWEEAQVVVYGLCGLAVLGWGGMMRGSRWEEFASVAEKTGLLALMIFAYPLCWSEFHYHRFAWEPGSLALLIALSVGAVAMLAKGLYRRDLALDRQWRWTWGITLVGIAALFWVWLAVSAWGDGGANRWEHNYGTNWLMTIGLFVAALLQVQVGVALRSRFMVNLAVLMMALVILSSYVTLFGSMATTGLMFVVSGIFLIAFGIYLEKKRRKFIARIRASAPAISQPSN